jgi:hypothetical protein
MLIQTADADKQHGQILYSELFESGVVGSDFEIAHRQRRRDRVAQRS